MGNSIGNLFTSPNDTPRQRHYSPPQSFSPCDNDVAADAVPINNAHSYGPPTSNRTSARSDHFEHQNDRRRSSEHRQSPPNDDFPRSGRRNDKGGDIPPMNVNQVIKTGDNSSVCNQTIGRVEHLQIGNTINLTMDSRSRPKVHRQRSNSKRSTIPQGILGSKTVVTTDTMHSVSKELGYSWKRLARELNLDEFELEAIEHDYTRDGLCEMAFQMLRLWSQKQSYAATVGVLARALDEIGRVDIALKLKP